MVTPAARREAAAHLGTSLEVSGVVRGRPPGSAAGNNGAISPHSRSVTSLA